jgi:tyrosine-protein kinase Etk/Wzc
LDNKMETIQTGEQPQAEAMELTPQYPDGSELGMLEILIVLAKRKRLILIVTIGAAVVAAVVSLQIPNRYTATAKILPPQPAPSAAAMLLGQLTARGPISLNSAGAGVLGLRSPNDIYIGMLKSRAVQDALIANFDLAQVYDRKKATDIRKALAAATDINSGKDDLISIAVEDKVPKRAADLANAYVEELSNLTRSLAVTEASRRRVFWEQQLQQAQDALAGAEVALKETRQSTGIIDLDSQAKAIVEAIGSVHGQIAAKEVESQAMRTFATASNPDYILLQQELAGLRAQRTKLEQQATGGNGDPVVATAKIPAVALEYVRRLREMKYRETVFTLLAQQLEMARLDESKQGAIIQVLDQAVIPDKRSSPKRLLIVILTAFTAFAFGTVYVLLSEALDRARQDAVRAEQLATLRKYLWGDRLKLRRAQQ